MTFADLPVKSKFVLLRPDGSPAPATCTLIKLTETHAEAPEPLGVVKVVPTVRVGRVVTLDS